MKKIHLLLCIVLACSAFTCNSGNTTSETPAGDSAPAMASNDKDEVLTVFRHVDRTEAVSYQVADSELDPREFPDGFYSFTKCHLMWPKTIYGKTSRKGKDASHTKSGIVYKSVKANRGSRSDSAGDRRARGGGSSRRRR